MPIGSGVTTTQLLPDVPFVIDPATFADSTTENVSDLTPIPAPGPGESATYTLPDADVVGELKLAFIGSLTVTAAGTGQTQPVPSRRWPYGLLDEFTLTANGISHDLWSLDGADLFVKNFVGHLGQSANADVFPGAVGGGGTALAAGTYPLHLSWEIDIATSKQWLVAALFAQSSQNLLSGTIGQAQLGKLVAPGGTPNLWSFSGSFYITEVAYEIPLTSKGELVLPDITKLHLCVAIERPWTNSGDVEVELLRTGGQLMRVFASGTYAQNDPLSALPGTPDSEKIDTFRLRYGVKSTPVEYNPASVLASRNAKDYRGPVPYDRLVLDQMLHNPSRDMILLQGVTNLRTVTTVDSAVAQVVGQANMRAVEEILA